MVLKTGYGSLTTSGSLYVATANSGASGVSGYVVMSTGSSLNGNSGAFLIGYG